MKRYVAGIILMVIGCLSLLLTVGPLLQAYREEDARIILRASDNLCYAILLAGGGFFLYRAGYQARKNQASVEQLALEMIRERGKIDHSAIAAAVRLPEADVRRIVTKSQQDGAIPPG